MHCLGIKGERGLAAAKKKKKAPHLNRVYRNTNPVKPLKLSTCCKISSCLKALLHGELCLIYDKVFQFTWMHTLIQCDFIDGEGEAVVCKAPLCGRNRLEFSSRGLFSLRLFSMAICEQHTAWRNIAEAVGCLVPLCHGAIGCQLPGWYSYFNCLCITQWNSVVYHTAGHHYAAPALNSVASPHLKLNSKIKWILSCLLSRGF